MSTTLLLKTNGNILKNYHFWVILVISLLLIFIYQAWPWRSWNVEPWLLWLSPLHKLASIEVMNRIIGVLFLVPIIYAAVVFSWPGALVTFMLSLAVVLPIIADYWPLTLLMTNIILLMLPVLFASLISFQLTLSRKEKNYFAAREAERRMYISKVLNSQENERRRFARELHDNTIQNLLVIANHVQTLIPVGGDNTSEVNRNLEYIRDAILKDANDIRRVCLDLRPSVLDNMGLISALRWLVDHESQESGINIQILVINKERKLLAETEATIFRIIQEALNNIKHHSKAKEAVITLEFAPAGLKIAVEDKGQGFCSIPKFAQLASEGKLGLLGIKERVDLIGGRFQIRSQPGKGTSLLIEAKC